jgi:tetratricopeptide (TPR) repeat protein
MDSLKIESIHVENKNIVFEYAGGEENKNIVKTPLESYLNSFFNPRLTELKRLKLSLAQNVNYENYNTKEILELSWDIGRLEGSIEAYKPILQLRLKKLGKKNLQKVSSRYQKALQLFLNHKIESALEILEKVELTSVSNGPNETLKQKSETSILKAWLLDALTNDNWYFKKTSNKEAIEASLEEALSILPDWENYMEVADCYFNQVNKFEKAAFYYKIALEKAVSDHQRAITLYNFGSCQAAQNERTKYDKASEYFLEALKCYRKLASKNREVYSPYVAKTLNKLGKEFHFSPGSLHDKAYTCYTEALQIYIGLALKHPKLYLPEVAKAWKNFGVFCRITSGAESREALLSLRKAVKLYRKLARKNPDTYLPLLADSLKELAFTYSDVKSDFEKSARIQKEVIEIYRHLAVESPKEFLPKLAQTLYISTEVFTQQKKYSEVLENYTESLEIYQSMVLDNPYGCTNVIGQLQISLADFFSKVQADKERSLQLVHKGLKNLFHDHPHLLYQSYVAKAIDLLTFWQINVPAYLAENGWSKLNPTEW